MATVSRSNSSRRTLGPAKGGARIRLINAETKRLMGYAVGIAPFCFCAPEDIDKAMIVRLPTETDKASLVVEGRPSPVRTGIGENRFSIKLWKVASAPDLGGALEVEALWYKYHTFYKMLYAAPHTTAMGTHPANRVFGLHPAKIDGILIRLVLEAV